MRFKFVAALFAFLAAGAALLAPAANLTSMAKADDAFGYSPCPGILPGPERASGMAKQDFHFFPVSKHQKSGTDFSGAAHKRSNSPAATYRRTFRPGLAKYAGLCMILSRLRRQCRLPREPVRARAEGGLTDSNCCTGANANAI